jgi:hypothetical protein
VNHGPNQGDAGNRARLADYLSASLLARVIPATVVNDVLDAHGRNTQRLRSFPAVVGVYYTVALSLYPEAGYEEVIAAIAQGLAWAARVREPLRISKVSISNARAKIGWAPLHELVRRCCVPMAQPASHPQSFYKELRLVAIDGSNFELPDTADNVAAFGRPGSRTGVAGYPQAQCAVLMECGTHAIIGANLGPYRASEWEVCQPLLEYLKPGMLCLADRGFSGFEYWADASATGAQLLWPCPANRILPPLTELSDGSYLSSITPSGVSKAQAQARSITVRVIEYALPGLPDGQPRYRLLTTLLDPQQAPALELAALYHQRWQVEEVFDELKTHLLKSRRVLRSKTAELVRQEFYGWVLAHYAVRWLLHEGATRHRIPHPELSFASYVQTAATRTGPIRGFSPQRGRRCAGGTSPSRCRKAPGCEPRVRWAGAAPECSSGAIRRTPRSTQRCRDGWRWTARRSCSRRDG